MKPTHWCCLILWVMPTCLYAEPPEAVAPPAARAPIEQPNAALWYWRAIHLAGPDLSDRVRAVVGDLPDPEWTPSPELRELIDGLEDSLDELQRGAAHEWCDWGADYDMGINNMRLPHVAPMRMLAIVAAADAQVRLVDGAVDGCVDRLTTLLRMSRHVGQCDNLICGVAANSLFVIACNSIERAIESGLLSADHQASLLRELGRLDPSDPASIRAAAVGEAHRMLPWVERDMENDAAQIRQLLRDSGRNESVELITNLVAARSNVAAVRRYANDMAAAWHAPDVSEAVARVESGIAEDKYGALVRVFTPSHRRAVEQYIKSIEMLNTIKDRLGAMEPVRAPDE